MPNANPDPRHVIRRPYPTSVGFLQLFMEARTRLDQPSAAMKKGTR